MRKQSYLSFKDLRVFYDKKTDNIKLTSGDPHLAAEGWSLTLNRGSRDERILRKTLIEAGIIERDKPVIPGLPKMVPTPGALPIPPRNTPTRPGSGQSIARPVGTPYNAPRASGGYITAHTTQMSEPIFMAPPALITGPPTLTTPIEEPPAPSTQSDDKTGRWYIGHTTRATNTPVFFNPHVDIHENKAPGCLISGSVGSGRQSFLHATAHKMRQHGAHVIHLDPRGDAIGMMRYPDMAKAKVFNLRDMVGWLDPFMLANMNHTERIEQVISVLTILLNGTASLQPKQRAAIITAVDEEEQGQEPATLMGVVDRLLKSWHGTAELFADLRLIRTLPFANTMLGTRRGTQPDLTGGYSLVNMVGLTLPQVETTGQVQSLPERLGSAILYMLLQVSREQFSNMSRTVTKALILDNAELVTMHVHGQQVLSDLTRLGRSLNIGIVLGVTNPKDIANSTLNHAMTTHFAFRAVGPETIEDTLSMLDLVSNNFNHKTLRNLRGGECLMRRQGNIVTVQTLVTNSMGQHNR